MRITLRAVLLYLVSVLTGYLLLTQVTPFVAFINADHLPWMESRAAQAAFLYHCMVRGGHVLAATTLVAVIGFWMKENRALRRVTLTLPIWTAFLYTQIYILMMMK